jgi:hypothetical protein
MALLVEFGLVEDVVPFFRNAITAKKIQKRSKQKQIATMKIFLL